MAHELGSAWIRPWPGKAIGPAAASVLPQEWLFPDHALEENGYHYNNGFFEAVDAEVAYSFVRHWKPRRIIEIGGGFSTRIMNAALHANHKYVAGELITIDPNPERVPCCPNIEVIARRVQDVPLDTFLSLQEGDILFLDSSHVVGVGSDVVREYLDIIPRLRRGVLIHIHDIFLPSDYPRDAVLNKLCFWSEQYLLEAFLSFNPKFEILWSSSAMQIFFPDLLEAAFPPGSRVTSGCPSLSVASCLAWMESGYGRRAFG